jgi:DNA-binding winged helix-turn-helix (wHTH) protein
MHRGRRIWRVGEACFDETTWALSVGGRPVPLEAKPLGVLHELLQRYGEVVTKDELLDAVWCDQREPAAEWSLTTAISKLRRTLGEEAARQIKTVQKVGYRLDGPVTFEQVPVPVFREFAWEVGQPVPRRTSWLLAAKLGSSEHSQVWRARNIHSKETRVFHLTTTLEGLQALRREVAIAQRLARLPAGARPGLELLEWSFEEPPFFLETVDRHPTLAEWASAAGGLDAVPLDRRLAVAAAASHALAAAHGLGVVHGDLSPAAILVEENGQVRLVDFRSEPDHPSRSDPLDPNEKQPGGSLHDRPSLYVAPELRAGAPPDVRSDIFALGIILYQMVIGDFSLPLVPGWVADVGDPLIAEDVAAAAAGDPAERLHSAADLAERLETLDDRRAEADRARAAAADALALAEAERRRRTRAPWIRAAAIILVLGLTTTSAALVTAIQARDTAVQERRAATAAYEFLSEDLLARVAPERADAADETLTQAVLRARGEIDRRFAKQPLLAGRLHNTLAAALTHRSQWDEARRSYKLADAAFRRAGPAGSVEAAENRMVLAATEATSAQPGSLERAVELIAAEKANNPDAGRGAVGVKLAQAEGLVSYFHNPQDAPRHLARAAALAQTVPGEFSAVERLQLRQAAAMAQLRIGDAAGAEPKLRAVAEQIARLQGADHPDALLASGSVLAATLLSGRFAEASTAVAGLLPQMERRFGPEHRFTLSLLSIRSQALGAQGRFQEAARDAERVWKSALKREGPGQQAQIGQLDLAHYLCRGRQAAEGERHARAAYVSVMDASGAGDPLSHTASFILGECLAAAGQPDKALPLYRTVDPAAVGLQVGDGNWAPNLHLAMAEAYLASGERDQARRALEGVGGAFEAASADAIQRMRARKVREILN